MDLPPFPVGVNDISTPTREDERSIEDEHCCKLSESNGAFDILRAIQKLSARIDSLEKKIDSQEKKIDSQEKKIDSLEKKIDSQEKKIDSQEKKIDSQEKKIDSLEKKIEHQGTMLAILTRQSEVYYYSLAAELLVRIFQKPKDHFEPQTLVCGFTKQEKNNFSKMCKKFNYSDQAFFTKANGFLSSRNCVVHFRGRDLPAVVEQAKNDFNIAFKDKVITEDMAFVRLLFDMYLSGEMQKVRRT